MPNRYETFFTLIPALSVEQAKEAASKFRKILKDFGARILYEEDWGPTKSQKPAGYHHLIEFEATPWAVAEFELAFKRDKRVLRFLTVRLDKHALRGGARARFGEWLAGQEGAAADTPEEKGGGE